MNACSICRSPRVTNIDAAVNAKRPASRIARDHGVDAQALRRHIRNGHVVPLGGAVSRVHVITAAQANRTARAEEQWATWKESLTGVPAADLLACFRTHVPDERDEAECVAGSVIVESDLDMVTAFEKAL